MPGVPDWGPDGLIPPVDIDNPVSKERSPYMVKGNELVIRFGTTVARRRILKGLMEYRAFLRSMGIAKGFHWLDGSFMEQVEKLRDRDPEDLDIVSFLHLPPDVDQAGLAAAAPELFDREKVRRDYHLDAYVHILSDAPERLIEHGAYWSSVWAHQRDSLSWKGFVQLDLDLDDQEALKLLEAHAEGGGNTHA